MHENIESNDNYLDESLHKNNNKMELAIQITAKDKTVRSDTLQDLEEIINLSLATQAKKEELLVSLCPLSKKLLF